MRISCKGKLVMEQKELAIHVDRVSKVYKLYQQKPGPSDRIPGTDKKKLSTPHYALKDVSLDIYKGETVGIIGTNGSGKSTILKISPAYYMRRAALCR